MPGKGGRGNGSFSVAEALEPLGSRERRHIDASRRDGINACGHATRPTADDDKIVVHQVSQVHQVYQVHQATLQT